VKAAIDELSTLELLDPQDRARLVYLLFKFDKIARRAPFHIQDQVLLKSFDKWFLSLF